MTSPRFDLVEDRRAIIDRRVLADRIAALPNGKQLSDEIRQVLADALDGGRAEIARRFVLAPARGRTAAASYAFLTDQLVRLAFDSTAERLTPDSAEEAVSLIGIGGSPS